MEAPDKNGATVSMSLADLYDMTGKPYPTKPGPNGNPITPPGFFKKKDMSVGEGGIDQELANAHKQWVDGYKKYSKNDIKVLSMKGQFWKWRMHGGAITLAKEFHKMDWLPDLIFSTDMIDITTFLSLTRKKLFNIPTVIDAALVPSTLATTKLLTFITLPDDAGLFTALTAEVPVSNAVAVFAVMVATLTILGADIFYLLLAKYHCHCNSLTC